MDPQHDRNDPPQGGWLAAVKKMRATLMLARHD